MNIRSYRLVLTLGLVLLPALAVSADPEREAYDRGISSINKGDFNTAITALTEAIQLN